MKLREIIRWLLVITILSFPMYFIASVHWAYVFSHPITASTGIFTSELYLDAPFLIAAYFVARRQYGHLFIFACILAGLCIPWLTCFVFIYAKQALLRPSDAEPGTGEAYQSWQSGFPIPFMERNDISVGMHIDWALFWIDAFCWTIVIWAGFHYLLRRLRLRRDEHRVA
jgi:hypothetical protein